MHAPTPWRYRILSRTIAIKAADGRTVCSCPMQGDQGRRMANAKLICAAVNERMRREPPINLPFSVVPTCAHDPGVAAGFDCPHGCNK